MAGAIAQIKGRRYDEEKEEEEEEEEEEGYEGEPEHQRMSRMMKVKDLLTWPLDKLISVAVRVGHKRVNDQGGWGWYRVTEVQNVVQEWNEHSHDAGSHVKQETQPVRSNYAEKAIAKNIKKRKLE